MLTAVVVVATACGRDDLDTRYVRAAVVTIEAAGCSLAPSRGVGIAVGDPGMIVTVAHTIAGATEVMVIQEDGSRHRADISWFDPRSDIAVLRIADVSRPGLNTGRAEPGRPAIVLATRTDSGIVVVPAKIDKFIAVTIDDIYREETANLSGLEISAEIRRGDSGAGVIDAQGRVVGIVYARSRQRPGVAFALDDSEVRRALDSAIDSPVANGRCR